MRKGIGDSARNCFWGGKGDTGSKIAVVHLAPAASQRKSVSTPRHHPHAQAYNAGVFLVGDCTKSPGFISCFGQLNRIDRRNNNYSRLIESAVDMLSVEPWEAGGFSVCFMRSDVSEVDGSILSTKAVCFVCAMGHASGICVGRIFRNISVFVLDL